MQTPRGCSKPSGENEWGPNKPQTPNPENLAHPSHSTPLITIEIL